MKRCLKTMSICILITFLFAVLSGCGGSEKTTSNPKATAPVVTTTAPTTQQTSPASAQPATTVKQDASTTVAPTSSTEPVATTVQTTEKAQTVEPAPATKTETKEQTVYVTKTGAKYHRDGCRYLSKSKIPMNLSDAQAAGYEACSVCKP